MNIALQNPLAIRLSAPAKINTHLKITGINSKGYHLLDTGFVYIDLCDHLYITPSHALHVHCSIDALSGSNNLVHRILQAFRERHAVTQGMDVFIDKHIPHEAGLGGGSSDAATALLAANQLWSLHRSTQELIEFAYPFGADIPCFLYGKPSLAQGIGEQLLPNSGIEQFPRLNKGFLCLAKPARGLSTRRVFQHFDSIHGLTADSAADTMRGDSVDDGIDGIHSSMDCSPDYPDFGVNALESSAASLLPALAELLTYLRCLGLPAWMSGSGSSCVALCASYQEASALADTLRTESLADWSHAGKVLLRHPILDELTGT